MPKQHASKFKLANRRCICIVPLVAIGLAILASSAPAAPAPDEAKWVVVVDPNDSLAFSLYHGPKNAEQAMGHIGFSGWGPNWAWTPTASHDKPDGPFVVSTSLPVNKEKGQVVAVQLGVARKGPRSVVFRYDLSADVDVPLTLVVATVGFEKSLGGELAANSAGKENKLAFPLKPGPLPSVSHAVYKLTGVGDVAVDIDPAVDFLNDGDTRIVLAAGQFKAGHKTIAMTLTFANDVELATCPADIARLSTEVAGADWYKFETGKNLSASIIGMENWIEKPAGKRGGVRMVGDHFAFPDGTPVKFWGTNLSFAHNCAPAKIVANYTAARLAKYGINAVRLHKFSYATNQGGIGDINDSTKFDRAGLDRLDYFSSQLKNNGVYFGWSHTFGFHVRPGDRDRLLAYDEILNGFPDPGDKGNTFSFINFAPDVQDLLIESIVTLLKHKNPYTHLRYADEPALNYIELQNEDDIMFYASTNALKNCPTYRKIFMRRFAGWLNAKYGSGENLKKAWAEALKESESLSEGNIDVELNPWFFSDDHLPQTKGGERRRLVDTVMFLHSVQDQYYARYAKAIRDAGYEGPIVGSCWWAPGSMPYYLNLKSDHDTGYIDRHRYFGGRLADSMLGRPGSGDFSTGLQQVIDRPFALSEWGHTYPSLYAAEGPPITAIYGMGLQGWDAAYQYQSEAAWQEFSNLAGSVPWNTWETDAPTQLGQYPLLARMIYRGDVAESPAVSVRRVSDDDFNGGSLPFTDMVDPLGEIRNPTGSVPPETLAAGRVVVEFTPSAAPSTFADMSKYRQGDYIVSSTGQLKWDATRRFLTADTEGSKAFVGFNPGQEIALGNVRIKSDCPFASILLVAADPKSTLATGKTALLSAFARSCNTGFVAFGPESTIINNGTPPILMEPVKATITMTGRRIKAVNLLDHDGRATDKALKTNGATFSIDGAIDKTPYYEVVFE